MYGRPEQEGTAPRTIKELYSIIERDRSRFHHSVMASMLELYRNDLIDLLQKSSAGKGRSPAQLAKLNIRIAASGHVQIENLTEEECKDAEALSQLLDRG